MCDPTDMSILSPTDVVEPRETIKRNDQEWPISDRTVDVRRIKRGGCCKRFNF